MARTEIPFVVIDPATGNAVVGASVAVAARATGTASTVYAGETGATTTSNPRTTDANGRLTGWVERGAYTLTVSGGGLTTYVKNWDSAPAADASVDSLWSASAVVSTLPSSPIDGQVCFFQSTTAGTGGGSTNTMASVGAVWQLKYRAGSSLSSKWEFVGGPPTFSYTTGGSTTVTTGLTTYAPSSWTGPSLKVPVAGTYRVVLEVNLATQSSTTATYNYQYVTASTTGILIAQQMLSTPANIFGTYAIPGLCGGSVNSALVAGETLSYLQGSFTNANAIACSFCNITLTPIRLG